MNIDWNALGAALALVMVIEGMMPFINPQGFRRTLISAAALSDRGLRLFGLLSMLAGVAALYLTHQS